MGELVRSYAERTPVERVAVVGNAPLQASEFRANEIDSCDVVFRCNSFVLDAPGRRPAQGRKVHVVVFNRLLLASPPFFTDYRRRLYLMVEPDRLHFDRDLRPPRWPEDLGNMPVPNREITLPLSEALGLDLLEEPAWATTGMMTAWIAHTLFPDAELRLAGFSMLADPNQTEWQHAWATPAGLAASTGLNRRGACFSPG